MDKALRFRQHLTKRFNWDFESEPEEFAPVVVETWKSSYLDESSLKLNTVCDAVSTPLHNTPEEFQKNGGFTLRRFKCFPSTLRRGNFKNGGFTLRRFKCFPSTLRRGNFKNGGFTLRRFKCFPSTLRRGNFKNGGFTLRRFKCFTSTLPKEFVKSQQSLVNMNLCLRKIRSGKARDFHDGIVSERLPFHIYIKYFPAVHTKTKGPHIQVLPSRRAFSESSVFLRRISVDIGPYHRYKVVFEN